jgi:uncharacterized protein (DUF2267 family)
MMPRISMDALLDRIAQHGLADKDAARRSLRATLAVLGERLVDDEAMALAEVVPLELAKSIENSEYDCDFRTEELFERVRRRGRMTAGRARENAEIVLTALGECLSHDLRRRIARGLPEQAAELLCGGRPLGEPPPHRAASHARRDATLASGRPGSTHPVSEAAVTPGHMHSIARSPSPHGETKLSGAKGLTQERLDDTLAAGCPPGAKA